MAILEAPQLQTGNPLYSVEMFSGSYVDLSNPKPHQFDLESIAEHLAKVCRYAAGPQFFYTVAEHAYWVSKRLEFLGHPASVQLAGLHHDDAEAVMGDVTTPMKRFLADREQAVLNDLRNASPLVLAGVLAGRVDDAILQEAIDAIDGLIASVRSRILQELEASLMAAIVEYLGFPEEQMPLKHPAIKQADLWALAGEAQQATRSGGRGWVEIGIYDPHPDLSCIGLSSERAARLWLARHYDLVNNLD